MGRQLTLSSRSGGSDRWATVPMPVLDASVIVDCGAPGIDSSSPAMRAMRRLSSERAELIGPRLLVTECANALLTGVKKGKWSGADADRAYEFLVYLAVAEAAGTSLITADSNLRLRLSHLAWISGPDA